MKVLVLGSGISSLATAYYLSLRKNIQVTLIQGPKLGGWIETLKSSQSGVLLETGPRSLRHNGPAGMNTLELIHELGLSSSVVTVPKDSFSAKNRFIYYNNQLNLLPNNPLKMLLSNAPVLKGFIPNVLMELIRPAAKTGNDESLDSFMSRRFGTKIARNIFSAVVHGIYAGDTRKLSVQSTFKILPEMERRSGSILLDIILGRSSQDSSVSPSKLTGSFSKFFEETKNSSIYSFKGGMQTLSDALLKRITDNGVEVIIDSCKKLAISEENVSCELSGAGKVIHADHVFSGVPAFVLKDLLVSAEPEFTKSLAEITCVDVAVVNLVYQKAKLPVEGFGFLVPAQQDISALGCVFDSCSFPPENRDDITVLTVMLGGHMFEKQFGNPETVSVDFLLEHAISVVQKALGISKTELVDSGVHVHKQCIPQYTVGHADRVSSIRSLMPPRLSVVGASYDGVALNDCIYFARKQVDDFDTERTS